VVRRRRARTIASLLAVPIVNRNLVDGIIDLVGNHSCPGPSP